MYICICHALTDGDVRSAEAAGAATHSEVFRHFGVKPQCGRCMTSMRGAMECGGPACERRHADDAAPAVRMCHREDR